MANHVTLRKYYALTKPGIIYGNLLSAIAGYALASGAARNFIFLDFIAMLIGLGTIIASACVANNIIDRHIDSHMQRTKKRATVTGGVSVGSATLFSAALALCGVGILNTLPSLTPLYIAISGHILYVAVYGYAKRHTIRSTEIGALSGAVPPLVGYTAVTGTIDTIAISLFLILCIWQMVHFYAIALYRRKEYERAKIYLFPSRFGEETTKKTLLGYLTVLTPILLIPYALGVVGLVYTLTVTGWSIYWLYSAIIQLPRATNTWARQVFRQSLLALLIYVIALSTGALLP